MQSKKWYIHKRLLALFLSLVMVVSVLGNGSVSFAAGSEGTAYTKSYAALQDEETLVKGDTLQINQENISIADDAANDAVTVSGSKITAANEGQETVTVTDLVTGNKKIITITVLPKVISIPVSSGETFSWDNAKGLTSGSIKLSVDPAVSDVEWSIVSSTNCNANIGNDGLLTFSRTDVYTESAIVVKAVRSYTDPEGNTKKIETTKHVVIPVADSDVYVLQYVDDANKNQITGTAGGTGTISKSQFTVTKNGASTVLSKLSILDYSSDNEDAVSVAANGAYTLKKEGTAHVTVTGLYEGEPVQTTILVNVLAAKVKATDVSVTQATYDLVVGETAQITAEKVPAEAEGILKYDSYDSSKVSVDSTGYMKALAAGSTKVMVSVYEGSTLVVYREITVNVSEAPKPALTDISVNSASYVLEPGETAQIVAEKVPAAAEGTIVYATSNSKVATVTSNGKITAVGKGDAIITLSVQGTSVTKKIAVKVVDDSEYALVYQGGIIEVDEGDTSNAVDWSKFRLYKGTSPSLDSYRLIGYESEDTSIAKVDSNGNIQAISVGSTYLIATARLNDNTEITAKVLVNVVDSSAPALTDLQVNMLTYKLTPGQTAQIVAAKEPAEAKGTIVYSTSDSTIVSVDENGLMTAVKAGKAKVKIAVVNGGTELMSKTANVEVVEDGAYVLQYMGNTITGTLGDTTASGTVSATWTVYKNGAVVDQALTPVTVYGYESEDSTIVAINNNGKYTLLSEGTTNFIVKAYIGGQDVTALIPVVVHAAKPKAEVTLDKKFAETYAGIPVEFVVTTDPADSAVTWTVKKNGADVTGMMWKNGVFLSNEEGYYTVIAATPDDSAECLVHVLPFVDTLYEGSLVNPMQVGDTINAETVLDGKYSDYDKISEITGRSELKWASENAGIASVNADNGIVTANAEGTTVIYGYTENGYCLKLTVTVKNNPVYAQDLTVTPKEIELYPGETADITAAVAPYNCDFAAEFESNNAKVVVDADGKVTALQASAGEKAEITVTVKSGTGSSDVIKKTVAVTVLKPVTGVVFDPTASAAKIYVGETTLKVAAVVAPADAAEQTITYSSLDESIALVNAESGYLTGRKAGKVTIRATASNGVYADWDVEVKERADGLMASNTDIFLYPGETAESVIQFANTSLNRDALLAKVQVSYKDNDNTTASLTSAVVSYDKATGVVKAKASGSSVITLTLKDEDGVTYTETIKVAVGTSVDGVQITEISGATLVSTDKYELLADQKYEAKVEFTPADATDQDVIWSTVDDSIAEVDANGIITAKEVGTTTLKVASVQNPGVTHTVTLVVKPSTLKVDPLTYSLYVGETAQINASSDADEVVYTVDAGSNPADAVTVDANGLITAVKAGTGKIKVTAGDLTKVVTVTVKERTYEVTLSEEFIETYVTNEVLLAASTTPDGGKVTWKVVDSTNTDVTAKVMPVDGVFVADKEGTYIVKAICGDNKDECVIRVLPFVGTIAAYDYNEVLQVGDEADLGTWAQVNADLANLIKSVAARQIVSWTSENPSIVSVNADNGIITANAEGEVYVYAVTDNGYNVKFRVKVENEPVYAAKLVVDEKLFELYPGETAKINATVTPDDCDFVPTFISSNSNVAVDADGKITVLGVPADSDNPVTITVQVRSGASSVLTETVQVTVKKPVAGVEFEASSANLTFVGDTKVKVTAHVLPLGAADQSITYTSFDDSIVTVNESGYLTGVKAGKTKIRATAYNGLYADWDVEVKERAEGIIPSTDSMFLYPKETGNVTLQFANDDINYDELMKKVTVSVSNTNITYDKATGIVTAVNPGEAQITFTLLEEDNTTYTAVVYVTVGTPVDAMSEITLDQAVGSSASGYKLTAGLNYQAHATVKPEAASDTSFTWKVVDESIATVDANGVVTAKAAGTTLLIATSTQNPSASAQVSLTVYPAITSFTVKPQNSEILAGESTKIDLAVEPEDAIFMQENLKWEIINAYPSSSATPVVLLQTPSDSSDNGVIVYGINPGIALIGVTYDDGINPLVYEEITVTVKTPVLSIDITKLKDLEVGDVVDPLEDSIVDVIWNGGDPDYQPSDKSITWKSTNVSILSVDEYGKWHANKAGDVRMIALTSNGNVAGIVKIHVYELVDGVNINPVQAELWPGEKLPITVTVLPESSEYTLDYSIDNTSVAKYNNVTGEVEAVAPGKAILTVTATDKNDSSVVKTGQMEITVKQPAESIQITPSGLSFDYIGEKAQLTATVSPSTTYDKSVTWRSLNPEIATVDANGLVTAVGRGTTTIFAVTHNGIETSIPVEVIGEYLSFTMTPANPNMYPGETADMQISVDPADSGYVADTTTWTSSNTSVATVDEFGRVTAVSAGRTKITATLQREGRTAYTVSTVVTVLRQVDKVVINEKAANPDGITGRYAGETIQLTATVSPSDAANKNVIWSSANNSVATVDANGIVTITGMGETTVRAASAQNPAIYDEIKIIGGRAMVELHVSPEKSELYPGEQVQIVPSVTPASAILPPATYVSSDSSIASVDAYGLVTAVKPGKAIITVQIYGDSSVLTTKTVQITVKQDVEAVYFNPDSIINYVGEDRNLSDIFFFNDGTENTLPAEQGITWTSLDPSIASVDEYGKMFANKVGSTIIYATAYNGLRAELHVKIIRRASAIELSEEKMELKVGESAPISYKFIPEDTTEREVTWTSTNPKVAYYDANHGRIVAVGSGSAHITVTCNDGGANDTVYVNVIQPATGVKFTDTTHYVKYEGEIFKARATAVPDNVYDPTIVWSVSNPNVAVVDEFGVVTCIQPGESYIFATAHNGVSAIAHVTVNPVPVTYTGVATVNNLFIRDRATLEGLQLGQFNKGDTMTIIGVEGEWYKINYSGRTAYVHSGYVQITGKNTGNTIVGENASNGQIANCTSTTVYTNPGSGYETTAPVGTRVLILGKSGSYYKISYGTNMLSTGYVHEKYVQPDAGFKYGVATQKTSVMQINPNGYESTTPQVTTVTKADILRTTDARKGAGTNFAEVAQLTKGTEVMLNSQEVNGYYQVIFTNGQIAWVEAAALGNFRTVQKRADSSNDNTSSGFESVTKTIGTVNVSALNVRKGPGTNYDIVAVIKNGQQAVVVENANGWCRVILDDGRDGYVSAQYLNLTTTTEELKFTSGIVENINVTNFVTRCYEVILGRTPDPEGLAAWVDGINSRQMTPSHVVHGFLYSPEFQNKNLSDSEFLKVLYKAYFDRSPDPEGYKGWMSVMASGKSREHVTSGFDGSDEFQRLLYTFGLK
ncbi:MAG: Ig-like domain-containing protein [Clostridiales bacterium]|nr:Ig-like domain-containing protein [Clostridiales bacterium]